MNDGEFETISSALAGSIRLGYEVEVEADDPNINFEMPPDDEIKWLADWLMSEGWTRE